MAGREIKIELVFYFQGEAGEKAGTKVCSLFIPSAVNPTTGFLLVVPEERVTYLAMTPEQAMKMIVSAGALVPPR